MNSRPSLRFYLGMIVFAGIGVVAFLWYRRETEKDRVIEEQKRVITALEKKLDRAWAEELVADVRVNSVDKNAETGESEMNLTFAQYAPGTENAVLHKTMTLQGEELYVDALVVQFDRKLVEQGDGLQGKSMLFFRRAFGDRQRPVDGTPLYREKPDRLANEIPETMQVDAAPTDFERQIWQRFWTLANDPKSAEAAGIRVAQGEAPHVRVVRGQVYKLTLRSTGGLSITPRLPTSMVGNALEAGNARP